MLVEGNSKGNSTRVLGTVYEWAANVGVSPQLYKTVKMMLKGIFNSERRPIVKLNEACIKSVTTVECLGVAVDGRLNCHLHLKNQKDTIVAIVGKLKPVMKGECLWAFSFLAFNMLHLHGIKLLCESDFRMKICIIKAQRK